MAPTAAAQERIDVASKRCQGHYSQRIAIAIIETMKWVSFERQRMLIGLSDFSGRTLIPLSFTINSVQSPIDVRVCKHPRLECGGKALQEFTGFVELNRGVEIRVGITSLKVQAPCLIGADPAVQWLLVRGCLAFGDHVLCQMRQATESRRLGVATRVYLYAEFEPT